MPVFADFVRDSGRGDLVDTTPIFKLGPEHWRRRRQTSAEERRRTGSFAGPFWAGTGDTEYFATVTSPSRYYDRLGEAGIDYAILYPTVGLQLGHLADDDRRVELCRLYNEYMADQFSPYRDRFAIAAVVPMDSPVEAVEAITHAVGLGAKVALIPSYVRRQQRVTGPGAPPTSEAGTAEWIDTYGLDSRYDYDPVWAKAIDLGLPLAAHSVGMGFTDRSSVSNFVYNHIGHFGAVGEALAKSLFLGGVTRRFPRLRVALLEGGVVSGLRLFSDLVGHWHKRGGHALDRLNPANIDRQLLTRLLTERDPALVRYAAEDIVAMWGGDDDRRDDFAATSVRSEHDIRDLYCPNFYWGCEADDPFVGLAFDHRLTPLGARVPAIMGSDLGHWDVPEFTAPLAEAYELVERGILDAEMLREFVFTNAIRCYASLNRGFFRGTAVEGEVAEVLASDPVP
jgi:predicted TIM-barrel fold metal-dependent hydrolase